MKLIVGLANPGVSYRKTRHNVGRRLVEILAKEFKAKWKRSLTLHSRWAEVRQNQDPIFFLLATPELFMNESGVAVRKLVDHFGIDFKSGLLIVVDDAALPLGRLRLRASGQDGGHRGLRSIEQALGNRNYTRLRIGIGPVKPVEEPLEKYVLRPFRAEEEEKLGEILRRGIESCRLWVIGPIERAMDQTNKPL